MPRNGSGVYTLPPGTAAVTQTPISSTAYNSATADYATALTNSMPRNGEGPATGNWPMGGFKLTGLAAGSTAGDSVRYEQVFGGFLPLSGGTMTGAIAMGAHKITGLSAGTVAGDAVRFEQLGTIASQNANAVAITGGTITGLGTPLPIASGGTAGATQVAAQTALALLPGTNIVALSVVPDTPPIGEWMLLEYTNASPLADGTTTTGANLRYLVGTTFWSLGDGRRPSGTWKNVSNQSLASGGTYRTGQFVRTA